MSKRETDRLLTPLLCFHLMLAPVCAREAWAGQAGAAQNPPAAEQPKPPLTFGLEDGTPVKLRLMRDLSSATEKTGATVDFEVIEEVKVGETVVVRRGALALGTIVEAAPKRRMGRSGKLSVRIDTVRLASGEKVPLRAVRESSDGSRVGTVTTAVVAAGILFFPAAPLFLFIRGKDITVPKGTLVTAYVNGDAPLDPAKFATKEP